MNRLAAIASQHRRREPATSEQQLPAVKTYRDHPGHLADAGGAYLVLPYGLLEQLTVEQQHQLVGIVASTANINTPWATSITYQVLTWARVRPGDLSTDELTWHGITSDIDPSIGTVAYSRGGKQLHPETVIGHRPAGDPVAALPGTYPGARPALLPAVPGLQSPAITPASSQQLRTDRARQMIEIRRRRELLYQRAPTADTQWAEAIIAADPLWGADEDWKLLIDQTTTEAAASLPPPTSAPADCPEPVTQTPPLQGEPPDPISDQEAELAALEADLQDLYRP